MEKDLQELEYVGFWRRVGAALLDGVIILPFTILSLKVGHGIITSIIYEILFYTIQIFFIVKYGGTLGKLILKYRIVDKNGNYISIMSAILRFSPYFPGLIVWFFYRYTQISGTPPSKTLNLLNQAFMVIGIVDIVVLLFNKKKRAVHDFLANSFVVTKDSLTNIN